MKRKCMAIGTLLCIALILPGCTSSSQSQYETATELMEEGDYETAISTFEEIEDYEDSADKIIECTYNLGVAAMETEDWDTAISYFENLNYEDSEDLLDSCTYEKGMTENADYDFLADLEESILSRMENSDEADTDSELAVLVNTELAYLEKYEDSTFYDEGVQKIAKKYIKGLKLQKNALKEEYEGDENTKWLRGLVYREKALCLAYENYDFLIDNAEFIGTYISEYDDNKALLDAYDVIEDDLGKQLEGDFTFWVDDDEGSVTFPLENNTKYEYSIVFITTFYSAEGEHLGSYTTEIVDIMPGATFNVDVYMNDTTKIEDMAWEYYLSEVKI